MNDLLYVVGTIAFFALMLAFGRAAARLGSNAGVTEPNDRDHR